MADNDLVEYISGDIHHEQLAPSQAARTEFTPGKVTSRANDQNWPTEFRIPTGTPAFDGEGAGPVQMEYTRPVKLGRNIVSDQVIGLPTVTGTKTVTTETPNEWGVGNAPSHTLTETETQERQSQFGHIRTDESIQRNKGNDNIKGA